jgi:hypothetical protein
MDAHLSRARKKLVAYVQEETAALASRQVR